MKGAPGAGLELRFEKCSAWSAWFLWDLTNLCGTMFLRDFWFSLVILVFLGDFTNLFGTIALKDIWPDVPQWLWPELWLKPEHGGHGTDPFASTESAIALSSLGTASIMPLQPGNEILGTLE